MAENVQCITELIAYYCYKGLRHNGCIVANMCEIVLVLFFTWPVEGYVLMNSFYCASWWRINHGNYTSFWTVVHQTHICVLTEALWEGFQLLLKKQVFRNAMKDWMESVFLMLPSKVFHTERSNMPESSPTVSLCFRISKPRDVMERSWS